MRLEDLEPLMQFNAMGYILATELGLEPNKDGVIDVDLDNLIVLILERMRRGE